MLNKPVAGIIFLLVVMVAYVYWPAEQMQAQGRNGGKATLVNSELAEMILFKDEISALGTAQANESVTITAQSTDRVKDILFDDGDMVKQGQELLTLEHAEEKALVQELKVNLAEQTRQLERLKDLKKQSATAESAIDTQASLRDATRAQLEVAKIRLSEKFIHAPFSGQLGLREVSPGQLITNETTITTLDDLSKIKVEFQLPEKYLNQVAIGQSVAASNVAYSAPFVGQVIAISSRLDPVSRAFTVRAIFTNQERKLRPGMLLQLKVETKAADALVIPESAIIPINQKQYVYKVVEGKVQRVEVQIGRRQPGLVEIMTGLNEGDEVVTQGIIKVRPGSAVTTSVDEGV